MLLRENGPLSLSGAIEARLRLLSWLDLALVWLLLLLEPVLRHAFYFWLSPIAEYRQQSLSFQEIFPYFYPGGEMTPLHWLAFLILLTTVAGQLLLLRGKRPGLWVYAGALFFVSVHCGSLLLRAVLDLSLQLRAQQTIAPEAGGYYWFYAVLLALQLIRALYNLLCYPAWRVWRQRLPAAQASDL